MQLALAFLDRFFGTIRFMGYAKPMRYDDAVDVFLTHLRVERALSDNTVQAYGRDLSLFGARAELGEASLERIDEDAIRSYLRLLSEGGAKARTVARTLSTLKSFCRFLIDEGKMGRNPCENVLGPKLGRALPHAVSCHDLLTLLDTPDTNSLRGMRDRTAVDCIEHR